MSRNNLIFGMTLVLTYAALGLAIGLGVVKQESSYGLDAVLIGLTGVGTAWATGIFGEKRKEDIQEPSSK